VDVTAIIEAIGERDRSHEAWPMISLAHAHVASHGLASMPIVLLADTRMRASIAG
jgi:hypothetical protein